MIKILFVCHGNICRSPMAELVFRHLAEERGLGDRFLSASAATSTEEIGNPIHPGTVRKLKAQGVPLGDHRAVQMRPSDYGVYDCLLGMDSRNLRNMHRILGGDPEGKVRLLLDFTSRPGDIADPWFTGNFDATYTDILAGCKGLLEHLLNRQW